ncbi:glycosyltransferase family 4 protein [Salinimicrobium flavum]|uniref:Glycosyltransferase family 4 protein n=1 Tax=Salinimicrobium flavum TaxID=1737065 RepID=A0ABW5IZB5_9FLAO
MGKLKILYYSNAFIATHGGRLHSEAFYKESSKRIEVDRIEAFPVPIKNQSKHASNGGLRGILKRNTFLQILFFYRRNNRSYKEIIEKIRNSKGGINVLHIRLDSNFLIISKLKKEFPKLFITTEVNASPFEENFSNIAFKSYFRGLERKMLAKADANFFVSGFLRQSIMKVVNKNRDFVVHNGVDENFIKKDGNLGKAGNTVVFGYIGTIDYHKKLKSLIDSFKEVDDQYPSKVELLIVGDGPQLEEIKNYVLIKDLKGKVKFPGWVAHSEIPKYLQKIDVAIHHSAKPYMSPLKLFEYMAMGKTVIGPDTPAVREIFTEDEILFVSPGLNDLTNKMLYLFENKGKRLEMGKLAQQKVITNFKWENNAAKIIKVMQNKLYENN